MQNLKTALGQKRALTSTPDSSDDDTNIDANIDMFEPRSPEGFENVGYSQFHIFLTTNTYLNC